MATTRPLVYVHAFSMTDLTHGFLPEDEAYARTYFDLVTNAELKNDQTKAKQVTGAILRGSRLPLLYEHLPSFTNMKAVANFGVGINHIDFSKFASHGIKVSNTPDVLTDAVAELTLGLMLASARNIVSGDKIVREWKDNIYSLNGIPGIEIKNSMVGMVGMGSIGLKTAKLLKTFRAKIVYYNRNRRSIEDEESVDATYYPQLEDMLAVSDFVVILCPLTSSTKHLFGKPQFAAMKPTATLVNVGRGPVVDTDALLEALRTKQIRAAALDVTDPEPLPLDHPLRTEERVIMTPHWGSSTGATRFGMFKMCVDNLRAILIDDLPMPQEVTGKVP